MKKLMSGRTIGLALLLTLVLAGPVFAQTAVVPSPLSAAVAGKIIAIAGVVAAVLQGLKKFIPAISGSIAVVLSVVLAGASAYATADPGQVLNVQFFVTTITAALGANGIYSFMKPTA
jgi:hypothetical protein